MKESERKFVLNRIWPILIIISVIYAVFTGNAEGINCAIFESSKNAIELAIALFGSVALWSGLMKIIENTCIIKVLNKLFEPLINLLFPEIKNESEIKELVSMNIIANFMGLGNASTPLGLRAMEKLNEKNKQNKYLSSSMQMLILINTASIQLIPTTIFAIRQSLGSKNPYNILLPVWIATIGAAISGVVLLKFLIRKR